jgi:hypothetical protein
VDQNTDVVQSKVFLDPFLRELLEEDEKIDLIIFWAALKSGFWKLFFKKLLEMLLAIKPSMVCLCFFDGLVHFFILGTSPNPISQRRGSTVSYRVQSKTKRQVYYLLPSANNLIQTTN